MDTKVSYSYKSAQGIRTDLQNLEKLYENSRLKLKHQYSAVYEGQSKPNGPRAQVLDTRNAQKTSESKEFDYCLNETVILAFRLQILSNVLEQIRDKTKAKEKISFKGLNKSIQKDLEHIIAEIKNENGPNDSKKTAHKKQSGKKQEELDKTKNMIQEKKYEILKEISEKNTPKAHRIPISTLSSQHEDQIRFRNVELVSKNLEGDSKSINENPPKNLNHVTFTIPPSRRADRTMYEKKGNSYTGSSNMSLTADTQSDEDSLDPSEDDRTESQINVREISSNSSSDPSEKQKVKQDNSASTGEVDDDPGFFLDNLSDSSDFEELSPEQIRAFAELRHQKESERSHFPKNTVFDSDISDSDDLLNDPTLTPWERRAMTPLSERVKNKQQVNDPTSQKSTKTDSLDEF